MKNKNLSYTSASAFPVKLIINSAWNVEGKLRPVHLQFIPTNVCPLNCSFCSCKDKDSRQIPFQKAKTEIKKFAKLGGQAITITGGGEPLAYPKINEIIDLCHSLGLKIGLVTNGVLWKNLKTAEKITWCRISTSVENHFRAEWAESIKKIPIDWAFSYVYTGDRKDLKNLLETVIALPITHVRVVSDIFEENKIPQVIKDEKIIYQNRDKYTRGMKQCWISLVKPVLHVDGYYYPCCGVQYARKGTKRDMIEEMRCADNLEEFYEKQIPFDGSKCDKCYYNQYNEALDLFNHEYKHIEFI